MKHISFLKSGLVLAVAFLLGFSCPDAYAAKEKVKPSPGAKEKVRPSAEEVEAKTERLKALAEANGMLRNKAIIKPLGAGQSIPYEQSQEMVEIIKLLAGNVRTVDIFWLLPNLNAPTHYFAGEKTIDELHLGDHGFNKEDDFLLGYEEHEYGPGPYSLKIKGTDCASLDMILDNRYPDVGDRPMNMSMGLYSDCRKKHQYTYRLQDSKIKISERNSDVSVKEIDLLPFLQEESGLKEELVKIVYELDGVKQTLILTEVHAWRFKEKSRVNLIRFDLLHDENPGGFLGWLLN